MKPKNLPLAYSLGSCMPSLRSIQGIEDVLLNDQTRINKYLTRCFTPREALRMAYAPVILADAAVRFCKELCDYCAQHHLPYKPTVRQLRACISEHQSKVFQGHTDKTYQELSAMIESFVTRSKFDTITLSFVINSQLKKYYPKYTTEYEILTLAYVPLCLLFCVRQFETQRNQAVTARLSLSKQISRHNPCYIRMSDCILDIIGNHVIHEEDMIITSVKIISNHIFAILDDYYEKYIEDEIQSRAASPASHP